jgi:hypothetical protein
VVGEDITDLLHPRWWTSSRVRCGLSSLGVTDPRRNVIQVSLGRSGATAAHGIEHLLGKGAPVGLDARAADPITTARGAVGALSSSWTPSSAWELS